MDFHDDPITRRSLLALFAGTAAFAVFGPVDPALAAKKKAGSSKAKSKKKKKKKKPVYYKIVYHYNGGTAPAGQVSKILEKKSIKVSKLKKPTWKAHVFKGWYRDADFEEKASVVEGRKSASKRTLYAKWAEKKYTITLKLNGGELAEDAPESFTISSPDIVLPVPVREGYVFGGWFKDAEFTKPAKKVKCATPGNRSYRAQWLLQEPWETYMQGRCTAISKQHKKVAGHGDSFVFITDAHVPDNNMYSPILIRKIVESTAVKTVVFGGDILNWNSSKAAALSRMRAWRSAFDFTELYSVRGNHDANDESTSSTPEGTITDEEYYWLMLSSVDKRPDHAIYYHRDNAEAKIRYIFLDTDHPTSDWMDEAQVTWMKARIMELSSSWSVVVVMHQLFNGNQLTDHAASEPLTYDPNGELVCAELDAIYNKCRATIVGIIAGHCHRDYALVREAGYPLITTTCDAGGTRSQRFDPDNPDRPAGTTRGQAFDVFSIDTKARKIYATRVGAGVDREFAY